MEKPSVEELVALQWIVNNGVRAADMLRLCDVAAKLSSAHDVLAAHLCAAGAGDRVERVAAPGGVIFNDGKPERGA